MEWFSKSSQSYWKSYGNCKRFLDEVAVKLHVKSPNDWGRIKIQQIIELGGASILRQYKGSLFACLQSVYKGFYL